MSDFVTRAVEAFLESEQMRETTGYIERGRHFEALSDEELCERWAALFKVLFAVGGNPRDQTFDDLCAELRLRELDQPQHLVQEEMAALQERIVADYEIAKAEGRRLIDDDDPIMAFLRELGEPRKGVN